MDPPVAEDARGSCSWIRHARGDGPQRATLPEPQAGVGEIPEEVAT